MLTLITRFLPGLLSAGQALLNPWILLVLAIALGGAWFKGYQHGAGKLETYRAEQLLAATKINTQRAAVTEKIVTRYIKVKGDTEVVTQTIEKEVTRYAESNTGRTLDGAWRVFHDAAAANTVPDAARIPYGAAGAPPGAAEALGTVTANYAACHRTADRLEALQGWVSEQAKIR
jgi:hypothetical protein